MNRNWTDFYPEWTDPFQIRSSFLEKDLDPIKIQKTWSAIRIWNCCVQFLTMYARLSVMKSSWDTGRSEKIYSTDLDIVKKYICFILLSYLFQVFLDTERFASD